MKKLWELFISFVFLCFVFDFSLGVSLILTLLLVGALCEREVVSVTELDILRGERGEYPCHVSPREELESNDGVWSHPETTQNLLSY